MHCTRKINEDLVWVGADNRRPTLFEAVYSIPCGVSYNSYIILGEKTVLIDTVDRSVTDVFFENIEYALGGRDLDYVIVQHMEPDHSATLIDLLLRYPSCTVVSSKKAQEMISAFTGKEVKSLIVKEGDVLDIGNHKLMFMSAPMVHWPEVMVTYDATQGTLFSADAFGTFGALNGALFADEVDFDRDYLDEARRYYCNIVGKYGPQVKSLLGKVSGLNIETVCPLHGFVWRSNFEYYVNKYLLWSGYQPEKQGVVIAYGSIYGNTENAANALACNLRENGVECVMHDVSVSEYSWIIADAFKYSHLVFASSTYNGGIFVNMDNLLRDLAAHNLRGRKIAFIENGSWASVATKEMKAILEPLKDTVFIEKSIVIRSSMRNSGYSEIDELVSEIKSTLN